MQRTFTVRGRRSRPAPSRRGLLLALALGSLIIVAVVPSTPASEPGLAPGVSGTVAARDAPACPALAEIEWIGMACRGPHGMLHTFAVDGTFLGTTHGPDPVQPLDVSAAGSGTGGAYLPDPAAPHCVTDAALGYYAHILYVRSGDDDDRYAQGAGEILTLVSLASGWIYEAGLATGREALPKVLCHAGGGIRVDNVVVDTPRDQMTFNQMKLDLAAQGYAQQNVKYWVFFDHHPSGAPGGVGDRWLDPQPGPSNVNNGGAAMYAVIWGDLASEWRASTALHELGHTMGAVYEGAPETDRMGHCTTSWDVMCYKDPDNDLYEQGLLVYEWDACPHEVFDCRFNSYFNIAPAENSYLFSHWNVGSTNNFFLHFGQRTVADLSCPGSVPLGDTAFCSVRAGGSDPVDLTLHWGDGSSSTSRGVPGAFTVPFAHEYAAVGTYTARAEARTSLGEVYLPKTTTIQVVPRVFEHLSCDPSVYAGATARCTFREGSPQEIYYRIDWGDGTPFDREPDSGLWWGDIDISGSHVYGTAGTYTITIRAHDASNRLLATEARVIEVVLDQSPPQITMWDPTPGRTYDGLRGNRCTAQFVNGHIYPVFLDEGCFEAYIRDPQSGISSVIVRLNDVQVRDGWETEPDVWVAEFRVGASPLTDMEVIATNGSGETAAWSSYVTTTGFDPLDPECRICG